MNESARRVQWRMLALGSTVWAPMGNYGWRAGTVLSLGKNRGDNTVVQLAFETGGKGKRVASELYWRKAELKGKDKPPKPQGGPPETGYVPTPEDYEACIASERIQICK